MLQPCEWMGLGASEPPPWSRRRNRGFQSREYADAHTGGEHWLTYEAMQVRWAHAEIIMGRQTLHRFDPSLFSRRWRFPFALTICASARL